jgi:hypothetical protein
MNMFERAKELLYAQPCANRFVLLERASGAWLLKCALADGTAFEHDVMTIWTKIDTKVPRFTEPDEIDMDGNAITFKLFNENSADSDKVLIRPHLTSFPKRSEVRELLST